MMRHAPFFVWICPCKRLLLIGPNIHLMNCQGANLPTMFLMLLLSLSLWLLLLLLSLLVGAAERAKFVLKPLKGNSSSEHLKTEAVFGAS